MVTRKLYSPDTTTTTTTAATTTARMHRLALCHQRMNNLEVDEGTAQLVASEASAGMKGGWGDCDDLATPRWRDDVDASAAHHAGTRTRKEGTGDLSSSNPDAALKLKKRREIQACYRQNMPAENVIESDKDWIAYK
jgi:hypothetical protein